MGGESTYVESLSFEKVGGKSGLYIFAAGARAALRISES